MTPRTRKSLVTAASVLAVLLSCDAADNADRVLRLDAFLVNDGFFDVHLLGEGESMNPSNRVAPSDARSLSLGTALENQEVEFSFRAEVPEGVLGVVTCRTIVDGGEETPGSGAAPVLVYRVTWDGTVLTCGNDW